MRKFSKPLMLAVLPIGLLFTATASSAQGLYDDPRGFYFGAGAGAAMLEDQVEVGSLGEVDLEDDGTAWKIYGGWRASQFFGIEGGYRTFGEADVGPYTVETDGLDVSAVAFLPLGPIDLFAKGGVIFWNTDGDGPVRDGDGEDLMYGLGAQLNLGRLFLRLESEWFEIDFPEEAQMITGSVGWHF